MELDDGGLRAAAVGDQGGVVALVENVGVFHLGAGGHVRAAIELHAVHRRELPVDGEGDLAGIPAERVAALYAAEDDAVGVDDGLAVRLAGHHAEREGAFGLVGSDGEGNLDGLVVT